MRSPRRCSDSHALWRWSVAQPEAFWEALWDDVGVLATEREDGRPFDAVLRGARAHGTARAGRTVRTWFPGARLNFAENLLRRRDAHPALVALDEAGRQRCVTRSTSSRVEVGRAASGAARAWAWRRGDRVAGCLPNMPEAVIAMLAAASIGAIWSSCSPDFGAAGACSTASGRSSRRC